MDFLSLSSLFLSPGTWRTMDVIPDPRRVTEEQGARRREGRSDKRARGENVCPTPASLAGQPRSRSRSLSRSALPRLVLAPLSQLLFPLLNASPAMWNESLLCAFQSLFPTAGPAREHTNERGSERPDETGSQTRARKAGRNQINQAVLKGSQRASEAPQGEGLGLCGRRRLLAGVWML